MRKTILFFIILTLKSGFLFCQSTIKVGEYVSNPDLRVKIGEYVSNPNLKVKIGEYVSNSDFSISITSSPLKADIIVTEYCDKCLRIKSSEYISNPDISIYVSEYTTNPDIKILLKRSGEADFVVYSDLDSLTKKELVLAVLPEINRILEYRLYKPKSY